MSEKKKLDQVMEMVSQLKQLQSFIKWKDSGNLTDPATGEDIPVICEAKLDGDGDLILTTTTVPTEDSGSSLLGLLGGRSRTQAAKYVLPKDVLHSFIEWCGRMSK